MAEVKDKAGALFTRAKRRAGIENPSAADDDGNVGIVRGALRAFGEGDFEKFLDTLREDVAWEAPGGNFPGGDDLHGRDAVRDGFIDNVGRTFTHFGFTPESFLDAEEEDAVVAFGTFKGEGAEGATLEAPAVQVWQFKGNEAELVRIYTDGSEFPEVITEEKQKEWEEEERKKKEEAEKKEQEAKSESGDSEDSEAKGDSDAESKSDSDSEARSDDESGEDSSEERETEKTAG